jgi:hypothetical protein
MKTTPKATPVKTATGQTTPGPTATDQAATTAGLTTEQQALLVVLEGFLAGTSHDTAALTQVQEALLAHSKKTNGRVDFLNAPGVLLRPKVTFEEAVEHGVATGLERFSLLQGDIISTDSAFTLDKRIDSGAKYIVPHSTCDLVENRVAQAGSQTTECALLYPVVPVIVDQENEDAVRGLLSNLSKLNSSRRMYLPPFGTDPRDATVVYNYIDFAQPATISFDHLHAATRLVSLTEFGWRLFASHMRRVMTREANGEAALRNIPWPK